PATFCTVPVAAPVTPLTSCEPVLATPLPTPSTTLLTVETGWLRLTAPLVAPFTALATPPVTLLTVWSTPLTTLVAAVEAEPLEPAVPLPADAADPDPEPPPAVPDPGADPCRP